MDDAGAGAVIMPTSVDDLCIRYLLTHAQTEIKLFDCAGGPYGSHDLEA